MTRRALPTARPVRTMRPMGEVFTRIAALCVLAFFLAPAAGAQETGIPAGVTPPAEVDDTPPPLPPPAPRYLVRVHTQVVREGLGSYRAGLDEAVLQLGQVGEIRKNLEIAVGGQVVRLSAVVQMVPTAAQGGIDLWTRTQVTPEGGEPARGERHMLFYTSGGSRIFPFHADAARKFSLQMICELEPREVDAEAEEPLHAGIYQADAVPVTLEVRVSRAENGHVEALDRFPVVTRLGRAAGQSFTRTLRVPRRPGTVPAVAPPAPEDPSDAPEEEEGDEEEKPAGPSRYFLDAQGRLVEVKPGETPPQAGPATDPDPHAPMANRYHQERFQKAMERDRDVLERAAAGGFIGLIPARGAGVRDDLVTAQETFNLSILPVRVGGDGHVEADVTVEVRLVSRTGEISAEPRQTRQRLVFDDDKTQEVLVSDVGVTYSVTVGLPGAGVFAAPPAGAGPHEETSAGGTP